MTARLPACPLHQCEAPKEETREPERDLAWFLYTFRGIRDSVCVATFLLPVAEA